MESHLKSMFAEKCKNEFRFSCFCFQAFLWHLLFPTCIFVFCFCGYKGLLKKVTEMAHSKSLRLRRGIMDKPKCSPTHTPPKKNSHFSHIFQATNTCLSNCCSIVLPLSQEKWIGASTGEPVADNWNCSVELVICWNTCSICWHISFFSESMKLLKKWTTIVERHVDTVLMI